MIVMLKRCDDRFYTQRPGASLASTRPACCRPPMRGRWQPPQMIS